MTTNYNQIKLNIDKEIMPQKTEIKFKSKYQKWKYENNYRKSDCDKSCRNCINCVCHTGYNRVYYKCELQGLSNCSATDIRLSHICNCYKEIKYDNKQ